jgi:serine/threonine-protein kinase
LAVHGALPVVDAIEFELQLLSALSAAHDLGIVHRDIKPENLFLHQAPERPRILKVLDFGVARVLPQASERAPLPPAPPTATGAIVGTPRFASPEALRGEKVDHRADIFAAGLVLYCMLTRRSPYDQLSFSDDPETFRVTPPSAILGESVSPWLDSVIMKAIRWRLAERYQDVLDFAKDLAKCRVMSDIANVRV